MTNGQDAWKRTAAMRAVDEVEDGMVLGLGSGSTVRFVLEALAVRITQGLQIEGIPTSNATSELAKKYGIPLTDFVKHQYIDLTIDGADEVERKTLNLIKGKGGALLREKIVARASKRVIIVVDETKLVDHLGQHGQLPVEITPFGWETTFEHLANAGMKPALRKTNHAPYITDNGNYIVDCKVINITDAAALERELAAITGVIDSGLFINLALKVIVGGIVGVTYLVAINTIKKNEQ